MRSAYPLTVFLEPAGWLEKARQLLFVVCYAGSQLIALVLFAVFAFYAAFKDASAAERLSTACLSLAAGAYGTWARRLAQSESQILAAQHQRDMERMAFDAEGDRRRRNNETISALLRKLDALPAKGRERIISECLTLLRNMQQRTNPPGKAAS